MIILIIQQLLETLGHNIFKEDATRNHLLDAFEFACSASATFPTRLREERLPATKASTVALKSASVYARLPLKLISFIINWTYGAII